MHAYLFGNVQGENEGSLGTKRLRLIAEKAGLNMDQFNSCFDSRKYADRVQQDEKDGQAAGVNSTPSFLITYTVNGEKKTKMIVGAQPFTEFQKELEAILHEIG
jgi:predicted DsbA family dithiol-disulfide isomerase